MTEAERQMFEYFKNVTLTSDGVLRTLYEKMNNKKVSDALDLMEKRDDEVDEAIKEYNPHMHKVMFRRNKSRKGQRDYVSEKLPRARQRYINETELFFLLGKPIVWTKNYGKDKAYDLFQELLEQTEFDSNMREAKRLAGAETESAKLYHFYKDAETNHVGVGCIVLARSKGYKLRPLIDQYGKMIAFAFGYTLKENGQNVTHWEIQTDKFIFRCSKKTLGWNVETLANPTGKINVIYYRQPKAWAGAEERIEREEMLDSKVGDTNNYFADPIASATADVVQFLQDTDGNSVGKLIQMTGANSRFEYINPPQSSATRDAEKTDLVTSILFDTFTPDLSFESLRGMGTLSGAAIRNAMILGYIKRENRIEIYGRMLKKEKNLIIAILKYIHPEMRSALDELDISYSFAEPFAEDKQAGWANIAAMYKAGLMSRYTAVSMMDIARYPQDEIDRILEDAAEANKDNQEVEAVPESEEPTSEEVTPETD